MKFGLLHEDFIIRMHFRHRPILVLPPLLLHSHHLIFRRVVRLQHFIHLLDVLGGEFLSPITITLHIFVLLIRVLRCKFEERVLLTDGVTAEYECGARR